MKLSLSSADLTRYLARQLENFFPDGEAVEAGAIRPYVDRALERVEHSFSHIRRRYYFTDGHVCFDHLHSDQYASFLYFFANTVYREQGDPSVASKAYLLNKVLHGLDVFYQVALPDIFYLMHPTGTVIGRGTFDDFFCIYQNCSVGADLAQILPRFGRGVALYAGSRVIGECSIGSNCLIASGALILNSDVPDNSVGFGQHPQTECRPTRHDVIRDVFLYDE